MEQMLTVGVGQLQTEPRRPRGTFYVILISSTRKPDFYHHFELFGGDPTANISPILCFKFKIFEGESHRVRGPWRQVRSRNFGSRQRWLASIGLAAAVGVAYFLAARLSLFLLTRDGVAVFWPAAGVSSGTLIALRRNARWPVAVGVIAATIAANLTSDRTIWASVVFALCNAGEALLTAWLIERYVGGDFSLNKLRHVLWLLAAAIIATATSGVGAAVGYKLFHSSPVPAVITWWHWFSSDAMAGCRPRH
jgi:hypothetical protein